MNVITITGRLTAEPEARSTNSGTTVASIRIACDRGWKKEGTETDFFAATAFGATADFIIRNFHKGTGVAISGSMQNQRYTDKEGKGRDKWLIAISSAEFNGRKAAAPAPEPEPEPEPEPGIEGEMPETNDDDLPF